MQVFQVGGAVRDKLLGRTVRDRDYLVVGSTPDAMLAQGFRQVGADFPVFLHPETGEEYALARTERKSGAGYRGFEVHAAPDVTLEDDLARRDLTINAIAMDAAGELHDPYGGQKDLEDKVLRHVRSHSFVEDPVRVLRLARFAARYQDFSIAPETMHLVTAMVEAGELNHLVAERVWAELAKGLMEDRPSRMFQVLHGCGALAVLLPELNALWGVPQPAIHHPEIDTGVHALMVLDAAASAGASLEVRFAALLHDLGKGVTPADKWPSHHGHEELGVPLVEAVCRRFKVPAACRDLAVLVCREHTNVHRVADLNATTVNKLLQRTDAFRRPARFQELLLACMYDARGRLGFEACAYPQAAVLQRALLAAQSIDVGAVARSCAEVRHIPDRIHAARSSAIKAALKAE